MPFCIDGLLMAGLLKFPFTFCIDGLSLFPWWVSLNEFQWIPVGPSTSESKWVRVNSSRSKWVQMIPSESQWIQVIPNKSKWSEVSPNESKWVQVGKWVQVNPSESKWVQVNPNESEWVPVDPTWIQRYSSESNWIHVHPSESKWVQVNPNETAKWAPPPPPQSPSLALVGFISILFDISEMIIFIPLKTSQHTDCSEATFYHLRLMISGGCTHGAQMRAMHIIILCLGYHDVCFSMGWHIAVRHLHIGGWGKWAQWIHMSPCESKWIQVSPSESNWIQVSPSEFKWIQVKPNETAKWAPLLWILLSNFSWLYRYFIWYCPCTLYCVAAVLK